MVIFLALYPLLAVAGIYLLDLALPINLVSLMSGSFALAAVLSLSVLASILAAAFRKKDNPTLMSAWLFLFCGVAILMLGYLLDPFISESETWIEELFETTSFFPFLFFAISIASPLRILMLPRHQRRLYLLLGLLLFLAVFAVVFLPWFLMAEGPRLDSPVQYLLHLIKPVLDLLLAEPLALFALVIGLSRGSAPYFLLGLGLFLFLPEDLLGNFHILSQWDPNGEISFLLFLASQLYILNGSLLAALSRKREQP